MVKPYFTEQGITIYHGDCRDILTDFDDKSFDVCITDPPPSDHVHASVRERARASKDPDAKREDTRFDPLARDLQLDLGALASRLTRRWTLLFCDVESVGHWKSSIRRAKLEHIRVGLWVKTNLPPISVSDRPSQGYDVIEIAHPPGRKSWNGGSRPAVYMHASLTRKMHPQQKPDALLAQLVGDFSNEGDRVLDMCMGYGSTLRACRRGGRKAVGIEIDERLCELAAKTLLQGTLDWDEEAVR